MLTGQKFQSVMVSLVVIGLLLINGISYAESNLTSYFEVIMRITDVKCAISNNLFNSTDSAYSISKIVKRITGEVVSMQSVPVPGFSKQNKPDLEAMKYLQANAKEIDCLLRSDQGPFRSDQGWFVYNALKPYIGRKGEKAKDAGKFSELKVKAIIEVVKDEYLDFYFMLHSIKEVNIEK
ncbi:MAG: hypothetical protein HQM10_25120 [Candidatus Riflebacteria bacterium]|nr:hypothetical protein [Candidatus Riflebacteria bacterium]